MTRIVRKLDKDKALELSKMFDKNKKANPGLGLKEFCEANEVAYHALRSFRASAVKSGLKIKYSRPNTNTHKKIKAEDILSFGTAPRRFEGIGKSVSIEEVNRNTSDVVVDKTLEILRLMWEAMKERNK
jgi:hypothetical protein